MKASELIAKLEELKAKNGDVDVIIADQQFATEPDYEAKDEPVETVWFDEDSGRIAIDYYGNDGSED